MRFEIGTVHRLAAGVATEAISRRGVVLLTVTDRYCSVIPELTRCGIRRSTSNVVQPLTGAVFRTTGINQTAIVQPREVRNLRVVSGDALRVRGQRRVDWNAPDIHFIGRRNAHDEVKKVAIRRPCQIVTMIAGLRSEDFFRTASTAVCDKDGIAGFGRMISHCISVRRPHRLHDVSQKTTRLAAQHRRDPERIRTGSLTFGNPDLTAVADKPNSSNRSWIDGRDHPLRHVYKGRSANLIEPHVKPPGTVSQKDDELPVGRNRDVCFFPFEVRDPFGSGAGHGVPPEIIGRSELPEHRDSAKKKHGNSRTDNAPATGRAKGRRARNELCSVPARRRYVLELDSYVADVADALAGILLQAAPQHAAQSGGDISR